jgi:hypothetical protein
VRERRGSYSGFCCRLYPFICWIIIKEGLGNFSGGRSRHWVNHVNLCLSCIVCLLCFSNNWPAHLDLEIVNFIKVGISLKQIKLRNGLNIL